MSLEQFLRERRRHAILAILSEAGDYRYGEGVLAAALDAVALPCDAGTLREELRWLADRDLVRLEYPDTGWQVKLGRRGADAASGLLRIEGIRLPPPE